MPKRHLAPLPLVALTRTDHGKVREVMVSAALYERITGLAPPPKVPA